MKRVVKIFIFLLVIQNMYANQYNLNDLDEMKRNNLISVEDYEILRNDLLGINEEAFDYYSLKVNNTLVSTDYKVIEDKGIRYLDLMSFIEAIGLENYKYDKASKKIEIQLGNTLEKVAIDYKKGEIKLDGREISYENQAFIEFEDILFLREDIFEKLFLNNINVRRMDLKMDMSLAFTAPKDIGRLLDATKMRLERENEKKELVYSSQRKLFDLGYLRTRFSTNITKEKDKKSAKYWSGDLAYQGALLYGQFTANYDVKMKKLGTLALEYSNIWNEHSLRIENRNAGKKRNFAFNFSKDTAYYNKGEKIIIQEKVPLGSRVELLYMGTSIDIQDEKNGEVIFDNKNIKSDRNYELKIYTPDGKIYVKNINTLEDYNRQKRHGIKYDISMEEQADYGGKYTGNANFYYGITDKLTVGGGFARNIELFRSPVDRTEELRPRYIDSGNMNIVYGGVYNGLSYSFRGETKRVLSNGQDEQRRDLRERKSWLFGTDLRYSKYRVNYVEERFGKYYDKETEKKLDLKYDLSNNIRLGYSENRVYMRGNNKNQRNRNLSIDADYKIKNLLFNADAKLDLENSKNNSYSVGVYSTVSQNTTVRLENLWTNSGKEYETKLSLYNNNYRGKFDFSLEGSYSSKRKEMFTFRVSMKLADFLSFDTNYQSDGKVGMSVGIDKIIDLRNPMYNLTNIDVSRAEVVGFVDANDNDTYDSEEQLLDNMEVTIGKETKVTGKNGKAIFYGLSNGLEHKIDIKIKKPNLVVAASDIKIVNNTTSTVQAYIPVKPMIDLSGYVDFDKELNLSEKEKQEFYSDVLIEIKDKSGKRIELVAPDDTGHFDVSGLFPKEYDIEVSYLGNKYNIPSLKRSLLLSYEQDKNSINNFSHNLELKFSEREVKLLSRM